MAARTIRPAPPERLRNGARHPHTPTPSLCFSLNRPPTEGSARKIYIAKQMRSCTNGLVPVDRNLHLEPRGMTGMANAIYLLFPTPIAIILETHDSRVLRCAFLRRWLTHPRSSFFAHCFSASIR